LENSVEGKVVKQGMGLLLIVFGIFLWFGNKSGNNPTFPFAGTITMAIGGYFLQSNE
jgi:uncharacterized membrane protein YccC